MVSKTRHATRYKCRRCEARDCQRCSWRFRWRNRRKTEPKCPCCRETVRLYNEEKARRAELAKQDTCRCHSYPFPHRSGTLRFCLNYPSDDDPTEEELRDYRACLDTPRSGFC